MSEEYNRILEAYEFRKKLRLRANKLIKVMIEFDDDLEEFIEKLASLVPEGRRQNDYMGNR